MGLAVNTVRADESPEYLAAKDEAEKKQKELDEKTCHAHKKMEDAANAVRDLDRRLGEMVLRQKELEEQVPKLKQQEDEKDAILKANTFALYSRANPDYCLAIKGTPKNGSHLMMTKVKKPMDKACLWKLYNGVLRPTKNPEFGLCVLES